MNAPRSQLTTHVLDGSRGRPAVGVAIRLEDAEHVLVAEGLTDEDGRVGALGPERLPTGIYHLTFATGDYYASLGIETFYPSITVTISADSSGEVVPHYHVPILLSPFAYSTYRGS